jgi:creatinine amidohydrolase
MGATMKHEWAKMVRSVLRSGFDHVLLVANHIPNQPMVEHVAFRIRRDEGILIAGTNPQTMAASFLKDVFTEPTRVRGHGAEPGSSDIHVDRGPA